MGEGVHGERSAGRREIGKKWWGIICMTSDLAELGNHFDDVNVASGEPVGLSNKLSRRILKPK